MMAPDARYRSRPVLEIVAPPGTELLVHRHGHDPWAAIFTGPVPASGHLRLKVPRGHFVVVAPGGKAAQAVLAEGTDYLRLELDLR